MAERIEQIVVVLDSGERVVAEVEEYNPYDSAAYCIDSGWTTFVEERELFVSDSGDVYEQPSNERVGAAPEIEAMYEAVTRDDEPPVESFGPSDAQLAEHGMTRGEFEELRREATR